MPHHVFISYAHQNNILVQDGAAGWIAHFKDALESFLGNHLDDFPEIWLDFKMRGNAKLDDTIAKTLCESSTLISVVSPRYLKSAWCMDELKMFCQKIDIKIGTKLRIFKVLRVKTPLNDTPAVFRDLTGYEFFVMGKDGRPHTLDPILGSEYKDKFYQTVDDLAFDIAELLKELEGGEQDVGLPDKNIPSPTATNPLPQKNDGLYLALPPPDLWEQYHNIRRDLRHRKIRVLPDSFDVPKPGQFEDFRETARENLRQSKLAVHLFDKNSLEQFGDEQSYVNIQMKLAAERAAEPNFSRLIWLGEDLRGDDEPVQNFISRIVEPSANNVDVLPTTLETFKTAIQDAYSKEPAKTPESKIETETRKIYVLYDKADVEAAQEIERRLLDDFDCELLSASDYLSLSGENAAKQIIEFHNQYLRECDGVLIYWGSSLAPWVRAKLSDLQKARGIERQTDFRAKGVYFDGDLTVKNNFLTREAMILKSENDLSQFVSQLGNGGQH